MEVCYDPERMTLSCAQSSTTLGSNEGDMLLALLEGITEKEALISRVWGGRGLVVSDSSYYKTVHALRSSFVEIGLSRDSLKTLPKRGLVLLCDIALVSTENVPVRKVAVQLAREQDRVEELTAGDEPTVHDHSKPAHSHAPLAEPNKGLMIDPPASRGGVIRRNSQLLLPVLVVLGALLPLIYAYLIFHQPPDLEAWKPVWKGEHATLYAELSENRLKDEVLKALSGFEPPLLLKDTNYYVRKPLSQLLVSCVKPESHGEALCVNYLRVGKN